MTLVRLEAFGYYICHDRNCRRHLPTAAAMAMEITCLIPNAHACPIPSVAYNKERKEIYSGSQDARIKVWDVETGKQLRVQQGHQAWVTDLLYSYAACVLFSCSLDGNILVWSDKGKLLQIVEFGEPVNCLAWDAKGKHLIAGGQGVVQLFRCVRSSSSMYIKSDSQNQRIGIGAISAAAYDKDGKLLITGSYDGSVKLWSHEGHCLDTFNNIIDSVTSIAYIPQTKCYWITGKTRYPIIVDALAPANVTDWVADTCSFRKLPLCKVFHAADTDVAIGLTTDCEIIVWRYNQFGPHRVLQGHTDWVEAVVVACRKRIKIKLDAVKDSHTLKNFFKKSSTTRRETTKLQIQDDTDSGDDAFIPADIEVYSGGGDGALLKWQADRTSKTWALSELGPPSQHSILCMLHHQKLDVLISGSEDCKVRVWNLDGHPGVPKWRKGMQSASRGPDILRGHTGKVTALAICRDEILVSGSYDKSLRWWDLNLCLPLDMIEMAHELPIQVKWCNLDDGYWVTASEDGTIALWDPTTLLPIRSICYRKEPVTALLVDEINKLLLVSMQSDYSIRAYKLDLTGQEVCAYTGHTEQVHALVYLSNRNQYLSGSWDNSIRVWLAPTDTTRTYSLAKSNNNNSNNNGKEQSKTHREAEFSQEEKYVSYYEKEHPLVLPKQLQDEMQPFSSPSSSPPLFPPRAVTNNAPAPAPARFLQQQQQQGPGDVLIRQPALLFKLADLEKSLNDQIP